MLHNGKSKPTSSACPRTVPLKETLEDAIEFFDGNSWASIPNADGEFVVLARELDSNAAALRRELERVVQEVREHLPNAVRITRDKREIRWDVEVEGNRLCCGTRLEPAKRRACQLGEVGWYPSKLQLATLGFGQFQQLVHQTCQMFNLGCNPSQEVLSHFPVSECSVEQRVNQRLQRGERRAEIMGDVGDEVTSNRLGATEFRDITENKRDKGAVSAVEDGSLCLDGTPGPAELHKTAGWRRLLTERLADQFIQFVVTQNFWIWSTDCAIATASKQTTGGPIQSDNASFRIDKDHAVAQMIEKRG